MRWCRDAAYPPTLLARVQRGGEESLPSPPISGVPSRPSAAGGAGPPRSASVAARRPDDRRARNQSDDAARCRLRRVGGASAARLSRCGRGAGGDRGGWATLRGSRRQGASDAHLLSTFSHRLGMVLGHCPEGTRVADKTNEIGAASAFLLTLVLEGRVVTADALLTRREIARTILDGGGDYLLVVKANQPTLHAASATAFAPAAGDCGLVGSVCTVSQHGDRIEYRRLSASIALLGYRGTRVRVVAGAAPGPADRTTRHPQGDRTGAAPRDRLRGDLARPRRGHPRATACPVARIGPSRTNCTPSAMSPATRIAPPSERATPPRSWPPSAMPPSG